jgi:hypothetical protein
MTNSPHMARPCRSTEKLLGARRWHLFGFGVGLRHIPLADPRSD